MPLKVYNNLTRKLEEFAPLSEKQVGMYVCGITPYDETHLGHARAYITFDVVRRYLEYSGYKVKHIQNITDIDDKIINKAKLQTSNLQIMSNEQKKEKCKEVVDKYSASFDEVMAKLNVKQAGEYPKATENIPGMIDWIKRLMEKGFAYKLDDGIYFEVDKFQDYGKLSHRKKEEQESGARVEVKSDKKSPLDFALWKFAKPDEPSWDSPWGVGRPGWHIECSVMSTKYLGEQFDIHGGGLDLQFPHHENEIAQTEAATGKVPWVKYWIHNGFVTINKEKMSKSLGNIFSVKDLLEKYDPMAIRLLILSTHYRSPINFSDAQLAEAGEALKKLQNAVVNLDFLIGKVSGPEAEVEVDETDDELAVIKQKYLDAMDNDFNSAAAMGAVFELLKFINEHVKEEKIDKESLKDDKKLLIELCGILGLRIERKGSAIGNKEIQQLVDEREVARKKKDFKRADEIRKDLQSRGIIIEDTTYGVKWSKNA